MVRHDHHKEEDDVEELAMTILNRVKQSISFTDWMILRFGGYCVSCFSEERKLMNEAHEAACDRLSREMDVLDLVQSSRIAKFIAQLSMKKNNR